MRSRVAWLLAALALAAAAGLGVWLVTGQSQRPRLLVGFDDDRLKWTAYPLEVVRRQRSLGADAVRIWVPWNGEARPGTVRSVELSRAEAAARHTTVVLAVFGFGARTPVTTEAQARFCGYVRAALALVPDSRAVVVWNEANSRTYWRGTPAQYETLLARCYDELHAVRPVQVLDSTASAHAPVAFLDGLAAAYRASGRNVPLVDAFGHNPYPLSADEPPDAHHAGDVLGEGDYDRLVATLRAGFAHTAQRSLAIWYLEDGYQSGIPSASSARLHGPREHRRAAVLGPGGACRRGDPARGLPAARAGVLQLRARRRDPVRGLAVGPHLAGRSVKARGSSV